MEKRLAIALVLCIAWIILAQKFFWPPPEPGEYPDAQQEMSETDTGDDGYEDEASVEGDAQAGSSGDVAKDPAVTGTPEYDYSQVEEDVSFEVDTPIFRAQFLNKGAVLTSLKFKDYYVSADILDDEGAMADPANWLEIVRDVKENKPSFTLKEVAKPAYYLDEVRWEHEVVTNETGGQNVVFTYRAPDGLILHKTFAFSDGAFHLDIEVAVENRNPSLNRKLNLLLDGPCGITDRNRASFTMGPMAAIYTLEQVRGGQNVELTTIDASELAGTPYSWSKREGDKLYYAGITNNYFALLMKPQSGKMLRKVSFSALEDTEKMTPVLDEYEANYGGPPPPRQMEEMRRNALTNVRAEFLLNVKTPIPGNEAVQNFMFYAGPKSTELMNKSEYADFYTLIEDSYGSMAWINTTLIWILKLFHSIFGNWGVAIICLTFVVKIILFPLNRIQQTSMADYAEKMKVMKPKLDELKKKFKNNKKKFNEAQMKLMKEEGVRPPLMGCLVIFLQFPVFIGLFQVLRNAFELRHSPFILWVQDLSMPDALFPIGITIPIIGITIASFNVLPILMTVAFYYQQKMMPKPATTDPNAEQMQKIMKFMPILFGILFYGYASGLSLYWMTSNILSIIEYKFIRKKFPVGGATANAKA